MRSAFENGWPFTSAVDIFANSPALPLNRNTETESAGRSAAAPVSAPYAAQANAAHPAHSKIVRTRLMIVAPLLAVIGGWFLRRGGRHLQIAEPLAGLRRRSPGQFLFALKAQREFDSIILNKLDTATQCPQSLATVAEFVERKYTADVLRGLKPNTQIQYRSLLKRHILPAIGAKRLRDVRREHVQSLIWSKLRRMLNVAVRKKFLFANPCSGVEFPARVEGLFRPHYVTWSEQQKIEFAAPEYLRHVVRIVTETGLRLYKELTPMKKEQLDLENRTVWIPDSKTPNGIAEVPLTEIAVEAFRKQLALSGPSPFLFPSEENPDGYQKTFKTVWHATLRRAEVRCFRIYDLRSTYATRLSAGGVADEWVTQLLPQGDAKVFKRYSQMKLQMKREALAKLNRQATESGPGFGTAQGQSGPGFGTVLAQ